MDNFTITDSRPEAHVLHPTTKMVMQLLQGISERPITTMLDVGTGSGLLALTAHHIWPEATIIGSDISALAVKEAQHNIAQNAPKANIKMLRAEGLDHPRIRAAAPFDLICANLLAELQCRYAPDMMQHLAPGGLLILSGIQAWQAQPVEQSYQACGATLTHKQQDEQWVTYVFQQSAA